MATKITKATELLTTIRDWSKGKFVQIETGKGLSTNDYTTAEKTKLAGIAEGAQVNVLEGIQFKASGASAYSDLTIADKKAQLDLSGYALKSDITAVLKFKGAKDTYAEIAAITDAAVGDVWLCRADNSEYVCVAAGSPATWEKLGTTIDLSGYVTKTQKVNNKALSGDITLDGSDIALTGYAKPASGGAIASTDTVNAALGKLEYKVDNAISGGIHDAYLSMPSNEFEVTYSKESGTCGNVVTFKDQTARYVLAAPASAAGVPSFRALDAADVGLEFMTTTEMLAILNA